MKTRLLTLSVLALMPLYFAWPSGAAPDPVNCTGYPEPRIYLDNQSWWTPQPGPPSHPGTGQTGHIHVGMCFPLYQTITTDTLHLDVTVKLHNIPGTPDWLRFTSYNDQTELLRGPADQSPSKYVPPCPTNTCEYTIPWDVPLTAASPFVSYYQQPIRYNGWHQVAVYLNVGQTNAQIQRNWQRFYVNFQLPGLPQGTPGTVEDTFGTLASIYSSWAGGDTWYSDNGGGSKYSRADMLRSSIPWSEATGALTPLSGVWTPTVRYASNGFAYIDPALHASPPSKGTVVLDDGAPGVRTLSIDTTHLANGLHHLLLGSSGVLSTGTNTGVLVIPFLVQNEGCGT